MPRRNAANAANQRSTVDDTDGVDPAAEYAEWKLRHLRRLLRDREEHEEYVREQEEIERRRNMTEAERVAEDMQRKAEQAEREGSRTKYRFLQKYYHKGAFYQDSKEDVLNRDYDLATGDDMVSKELLPAVMQVRDFGFAGRTKWTHLSNEDTSKDAMWGKGMGRSRDNRGGAVSGGSLTDFEKPNKRRRIGTPDD